MNDRFVLLTITVAGQQHHDHPGGKGITAGETICVVREPDNRVDENAVRLYTTQPKNPNTRTTLGYIAQGPNRVVSRLLDAGYTITGSVVQNDGGVVVELRMNKETR